MSHTWHLHFSFFLLSPLVRCTVKPGLEGQKKKNASNSLSLSSLIMLTYGFHFYINAFAQTWRLCPARPHREGGRESLWLRDKCFGEKEEKKGNVYDSNSSIHLSTFSASQPIFQFFISTQRTHHKEKGVKDREWRRSFSWLPTVMWDLTDITYFRAFISTSSAGSGKLWLSSAMKYTLYSMHWDARYNWSRTISWNLQCTKNASP